MIIHEFNLYIKILLILSNTIAFIQLLFNFARNLQFIISNSGNKKNG
jgi:hypothetical protein